MAAPFWVLVAGIALTSLGVGRYAFLTNQRKDQHMERYWVSDGNISYRYMSVYARAARPGGIRTAPVYINQNVSLNRSDIIQIRTALQNCADSGNRTANKGGTNPDGRPRGWEDCFSSFLTGSVRTVLDPTDTNVTSLSSSCDVVAIEGNFTAFHPVMNMSGGFLPEIPVDNRQIVINDVLSWKLYKSYDVVGNKLLLWGQTFTVIGVVAEPSDAISRGTGTLDPRVYIYFTAMEELAPLTDPGNDIGDNQNSSSGNRAPSPTPTTAPAAGGTGSNPSASGNTADVRPDMAVMCYEAMLPEIVRNVAKSDMSNSVTNYTPAEPNFYLFSNTGRFNVIDTWRFVWPIGKTESLIAPYEFPYWERAAQRTSEHLFADEIITVAGVLTLDAGIVMALLRSHARRMSRRENDFT